MKKKWIIGIAISSVILLGTILYFTIQSKKNNLISITGEELLEKIENKETFILAFTQEGCSHCEEYKPVLNRVLTENDIYAYEVDLSKLRKNESTNNKVKQLFNVDGTPTTIFINDGEEKTTINRLIGSSNYSSLVKKLKDRGFITERNKNETK